MQICNFEPPLLLKILRILDLILIYKDHRVS